jgi:RimJ/RimL family protein N-acetyltransferase
MKVSRKTLAPSSAPRFVRALTESDYRDFREVRLEALRLDGRYFATSYEEERNYTNDQWRHLSTESLDNCVIGLFDGEELIGITRVAKWDEDQHGHTALFGRSYIKPEYRGKGLAALLYEARLDWARHNPQFKRAVVFHREGNTVSKHINERYGARYWMTRPMQWADGQTADGFWYQIDLHPPSPNPSS